MARLRVGPSIMESGCDASIDYRTAFPCQNPIRIYALYNTDAGCANTPCGDFIWYFFDGTSWKELTRNFSCGYLGYTYSVITINNPCGWKYKVTFAGMSAEFTVGEVAPPLTVQSITYKGFDAGTQKHKFEVVVIGSGSGTVRFTVDGTEVSRNTNITAGTYNVYFTLTVGTHTVCGEVV